MAVKVPPEPPSGPTGAKDGGDWEIPIQIIEPAGDDPAKSEPLSLASDTLTEIAEIAEVLNIGMQNAEKALKSLSKVILDSPVGVNLSLPGSVSGNPIVIEVENDLISLQKIYAIHIGGLCYKVYLPLSEIQEMAPGQVASKVATKVATLIRDLVLSKMT